MEALAQTIEQTFGKNLVLFATYGKVDQYCLLVLKESNLGILEQVKALSPLIVKTCKKQPLVLTQTEVKDGADVFPLEFLHIQSTLEVHSGRNIFKNLKIERKHVRRELEFEFRSKLINLRQAFLEVKNKKQLQSLLELSLATFMQIVVGLFYLKKKEVPESVPAMVESLGELYNMDFSVLSAAQHGYGDIEALITLLRELGKILDKLRV